jgi:hypothetical protein
MNNSKVRVRVVASLAVVLALGGVLVACVPPGTWNGVCSNGTIPPSSQGHIASHCAPKTTTTLAPTTTSGVTTTTVLQQCNEQTLAGGYGTTVTDHELGATGGSFVIDYNMYSIPDEMEVRYEGNLIYTTGGAVSGTGSPVINFGPGSATKITVTIIGNDPGTAWDYVVHCPTV